MLSQLLSVIKYDLSVLFFFGIVDTLIMRDTFKVGIQLKGIQSFYLRSASQFKKCFLGKINKMLSILSGERMQLLEHCLYLNSTLRFVAFLTSLRIHPLKKKSQVKI